jgi:hypothetical protein
MRRGLIITYVEKTGNVDFHLPEKRAKKENNNTCSCWCRLNDYLYRNYHINKYRNGDYCFLEYDDGNEKELRFHLVPASKQVAVSV